MLRPKLYQYVSIFHGTWSKIIILTFLFKEQKVDTASRQQRAHHAKPANLKRNLSKYAPVTPQRSAASATQEEGEEQSGPRGHVTEIPFNFGVCNVMWMA